MNRALQPATTLFAIGLFGLGVLAIVYHDFALNWQPVPPWAPGRTVLAFVEVDRPKEAGLSLTLPWNYFPLARDTIRIIETPRYVPYWNGRSDGKSRPARGARSGGAAP
jgi:hypothetical protein